MTPQVGDLVVLITPPRPHADPVWARRRAELSLVVKVAGDGLVLRLLDDPDGDGVWYADVREVRVAKRAMHDPVEVEVGADGLVRFAGDHAPLMALLADVKEQAHQLMSGWDSWDGDVRRQVVDELHCRAGDADRALLAALEPPDVRNATVVLFKPSGKYYTEEQWAIPTVEQVLAAGGNRGDAPGPYCMRFSPQWRRISGGAVLVDTQEPWGYPHLFPAEVAS